MDWLQLMGVYFPAGDRNFQDFQEFLELVLWLYPTNCAPQTTPLGVGVWPIPVATNICSLQSLGSLSPSLSTQPPGGQQWDPARGQGCRTSLPSPVLPWAHPGLTLGSGAVRGVSASRAPASPCQAGAGQLALTQQILEGLAGTGASQNSLVSATGRGAATPCQWLSWKSLCCRGRGRAGPSLVRSGRCGRCLMLQMGTLGRAQPHSAQQGRIWPRGAAPGSHSPGQVPGPGHTLATSNWCYHHEGHTNTHPNAGVRVWGSLQEVLPTWAGHGDNPRVTAAARSHHPFGRSPASDPASDPAHDPAVPGTGPPGQCSGSPASRLMSHRGPTCPVPAPASVPGLHRATAATPRGTAAHRESPILRPRSSTRFARFACCD